MSNKVVSGTYRSIIDDVIANVRQDFEEMGIEKEVLEELQRSWEARLVATGVTDFEGAPVVTRPSRKSEVKKENADDSKDAKAKNGDAAGGGDAAAVGAAAAASSSSPSASNKAAKTAEGGDATAGREEEANGHAAADTDADADGEESAAKAGEKRKQPESNSDEIGSDLDDSDDEDGDGDGAGEGLDGDTVLCLYEKVQRVRNRWKCVLKDGVANIDGRDYLFARCNTEFEW
ncbi:unnamed protein product [Parajaminaea phylloscopi]